jgi:serine/threonine protein kinase
MADSDLKSSNILVYLERLELTLVVRIADFGLAADLRNVHPF